MTYRLDDLLEAKTSFISLILKSEKALSKLNMGSGAHTYLFRRIKAFHLAQALIEEKISLFEVHK